MEQQDFVIQIEYLMTRMPQRNKSGCKFVLAGTWGLAMSSGYFQAPEKSAVCLVRSTIRAITYGTFSHD